LVALDAGHLVNVGLRTESPTVRLDLESRPQTLTIVRGMLGGVAELLTIDPELLDDLKTAVSEACNNVVLHAYGGDPGPMVVRLFVDEERIRVTVEDHGVGMPAAAADRAEGIGLSVIRALVDDVSLLPGPEGGTRVQMDFAAQRSGRTLFQRPGVAGPDQGWAREDSDEIVVSLSPVTLLTGVLGRLARTLAATAHFSLDRFSDVYLVTDTLAAHAATAAAGLRIDARLAAAERRLELAVGPFRAGASELLRSPPADHAPSPLVLLSDEVSVRPDGDGELLHVVVIDHRR
jgi:anti-sigma regulatory factor (Ser/Thr protein kinase)